MHEELAAFLKRLDEATTAIAARIDKLLVDQPLPPEIRDQFTAELERLEAMGKDPANPLP